MANKAFDFFDVGTPEPQQTAAPKAAAFDYFSQPSSEDTWVKEPAPPVSEQLKNTPGLIAREGAAFFHSLPRELAESYRFLAGKLQGYGEDLAASEGREVTEQDRAITDKFVNYIPDLLQSLGEKYPKIFPRHEESKKILGAKIEKHTGEKLPEKGRGAIERGAEGIGKGASILAFPGSAAVKAAGIATSAAGEALDLSDKNKLMANLTVPAITQLVKAIATRRYIPSGPEAQRLLQAGERAGMTPKELAPILATEGQVARHGRAAASINATRESFEKTGNALGTIIQDLQAQPGAAVRLAPRAEQQLITKLQQVEQSITSRTHALSPKEQATVDFIRTAVNDIQTNGSTPAKIIGSWRSVNRIGAGKTELARLKAPFLEGIESVSPQIAKDFVDRNGLYSKYIKNLEQVKPGAYNAFIDAGELQQVLAAVFTGNPSTLGRAVLKNITLKSLEKISSAILTNPTAQSLGRNFAKAVKDGRAASARALGIQLKEYVRKELPEEYKHVDWKALGIQD